MKLQKGRKYITRDGRVAVITSCNSTTADGYIEPRALENRRGIFQNLRASWFTQTGASTSAHSCRDIFDMVRRPLGRPKTKTAKTTAMDDAEGCVVHE